MLLKNMKINNRNVGEKKTLDNISKYTGLPMIERTEKTQIKTLDMVRSLECNINTILLANREAYDHSIDY